MNIEFTVSKLAVCHLGNYCTSRKVLGKFKLGNNKNYHGILVNVSQKDKSIFNNIKILGQKESDGWILYRVEVEDKEIDKTIEQLQKNMVDGFYFHFYRNDELIAVFKDKTFKTRTDKSTWKEIIEYGKSQGIPKEQLDFYPCKIEDEEY